MNHDILSKTGVVVVNQRNKKSNTSPPITHTPVPKKTESSV